MIDKFEKFLNFLAGVKPRINRRTSEKPIYASFHDRLFASTIDIGVVFLLLQDFFIWTSSLVYRNFDESQLMPAEEDFELLTPLEKAFSILEQLYHSGFVTLWLLNSLIQSLVVGAALVACWAYFNTTLGKYLLGLRFADEQTLEAPSLKQYIIRFFGFYLSLSPLMLGFALLGFSKKKQALHDKLAGTVVIYSKEGHIVRRAYEAIKKRLVKKPPPENNE